jgi:hypothetical protein
MRNNLIDNYRMGAYLLITMGLINLTYQNGKDNILVNSLFIIVPGVLLLGATWLSSLSKVLNLRSTKVLALALGLALMGFAILN